MGSDERERLYSTWSGLKTNAEVENLGQAQNRRYLSPCLFSAVRSLFCGQVCKRLYFFPGVLNKYAYQSALINGPMLSKISATTAFNTTKINF